MNVEELRAFIAVADLGTYTRAAEKLKVSQPAISRRISLLEGDLGTTLFERGRHGARLTDAGELFLSFAKRAVGEITAGTHAVRASLEGGQGTIRLAIAGTIPNTGIMDTLRRFRSGNPNAQLLIITAKSDEVGELVVSGEADAGLRYFADDNPQLESTEIAHEYGGIYCANPTTLLNPETVTPEALQACPWVMFPTGSGSSGEPFAHRAMEALGRIGINPNQVVRIDGLSAQKRLVISDFGIALMQASGLADELTSGLVQRVAPDLIDVQFPIHLVLRKHRAPNPLRDRFIATLQELAGAQL